MKVHISFALCISMSLFASCTSKTRIDSQVETTPTALQDSLLQHRWSQNAPESGDMDETYGIKPIYGIQDNYFDIHIGEGSCVAVKIVNAESNQPVRYVYVPEGETVTVNQIPQGMYYLKLAYGKDWMECDEDSVRRGKFTRNVFYEKSASAYDFGRKNSQSLINYTLEINVVNGDATHGFKTVAITEEEFEND